MSPVHPRAAARLVALRRALEDARSSMSALGQRARDGGSARLGSELSAASRRAASALAEDERGQP